LKTLKITLFDEDHYFETDDNVARSLLALSLILDNSYVNENELTYTRRILNYAVLDHENLLKEFDKINIIYKE